MHLLRLNILKTLNTNKVVWLLTFSDVFTWGSYYIVNMIAAIYLAERLGVDTVRFIGIGTAIYFFSRAIFQVPVGIFTDKLAKDRDEIIILAIGSVFMGLSFIMYPLITDQYFYYFLQFLFGLGTAMNLNTWRKLFARNLTLNKEGKAYGLYEITMSSLIAIFSVFAGYIANLSSSLFTTVIFSAGVLMIASCIWPLLIFSVKNRRSSN